MKYEICPECPRLEKELAKVEAERDEIDKRLFECAANKANEFLKYQEKNRRLIETNGFLHEKTLQIGRLKKALQSVEHTKHEPGYCLICDALNENDLSR